jgi:2-oxo-4-hydroxy-4-carboxy-5-ureidoimidazoline decarboxylase
MEALTEEDLRACCAAPAWVAAVMAGRPYADRAAVLAAADAAARALSWDDVLTALAAHPRIGERAAGESRAAGWSRQEQSAVRPDDALVDANRAYEERFGHVFLIFARGRGQEEIVAEARRRRENDEETERAIVRDELRRIALRRLEQVLDARG